MADKRRRVVIPLPEDQPTMRAEEVFAAFDIDRRTGYQQVRAGTFPVAPIRIGRLIRFPTAQVRRILDLDDE